MNTLQTVLVSILIVCVVLFIYFENSLVRILSATVFVAGAGFLAYAYSRGVSPRPEPSRREESGSPSVPEADPPARTEAPTVSVPQAARPAGISEELYREEEIPRFDDPRAEFDYLVRRLLQVLKDILLAHTTGIFWINNERGQIVIGEFVTDSKVFTTARRLSLAGDLVSKTGTTGKAQLLSEIRASAETELLPYYSSPDGVASFLGIPVYFGEDLVAVLAVDARAADAFGAETAATVGRFASLISLLLASYNQKFDLAADARILGIADGMREYINTHQDLYGAAAALGRAIADAVDWDHITIVLFDQGAQHWKLVRVMSKSASMSYAPEGARMEMDPKSILHPVLQAMESAVIDAPTPPRYRFFATENIALDGEILAVPIATVSHCYGLAVVEYREKGQYGGRDRAIVERFCATASLVIENLSLGGLAHKHLIIDDMTRTMSRVLLMKRLDEEFHRSRDHGGQHVFFLVALDACDSILNRNGQQGLDDALVSLGTTLARAVRPYDLVARFDTYRFGLVLFHTNNEDAFLQVEKLRKTVSSSTITTQDYTFSITASFGGCAFSAAEDRDDLLRIAQQVLDRAIADGGNCVKIV